MHKSKFKWMGACLRSTVWHVLSRESMLAHVDTVISEHT